MSFWEFAVQHPGYTFVAFWILVSSVAGVAQSFAPKRGKR